MQEEFVINRWNWSQEKEKWVYVEIEDGQKVYTYQLEPPEEFLVLTKELENINKELMTTEDPDQNKELFKKLIKISEKMQAMGKSVDNNWKYNKDK